MGDPTHFLPLPLPLAYLPSPSLPLPIPFPLPFPSSPRTGRTRDGANNSKLNHCTSTSIHRLASALSTPSIQVSLHKLCHLVPCCIFLIVELVAKQNDRTKEQASERLPPARHQPSPARSESGHSQAQVCHCNNQSRKSRRWSRSLENSLLGLAHAERPGPIFHDLSTLAALQISRHEAIQTLNREAKGS